MRKDQDDDKKVIGAKTNAAEAIFGIFENETANSFFQRILATSTDDIGKLIYNIPIIIYAIAKNQYIYVNSTFEKTLGYTLADLKGKNFWDIVHPDQREKVKNRGLARLRGEKVPLNYEIKFVNKNGSIVYTDGYYGLFRESGEKIIIVEAVDVTESKLLKEHLLSANDELEILVKQRTEELYRKNSELNFLNRSLNNVLTNISDGVVTVNREGDFEILNSSFVAGGYKILEEAKSGMKELMAKGKLPFIHRMIEAKEPFTDQEIVLPTSAGPLRLLASGTLLPDDGGMQNCGVIMLRPIKDIHRLVNRLSGTQAVFSIKDILTTDPVMQDMLGLVKRSAAVMSNVLITGESGTGKELFAQALHNESPRRKEPFLAINCTAMPRELIESELFGYEEGAFTGARKGGKPGKFELASGGTIFLDEIGDMPFNQQGVLLRVLQEKRITRIGGLRDIPLDVRVVCATNKDLSEEMRKGNFRSDLFYRLNVISIKIPPLRERPADITMLFECFLKTILSRMGKTVDWIQPDVFACLLNYKWPGNVRELQNVVERVVNTMNGTIVEKEHLPAEIRELPVVETCMPAANSFNDQHSELNIHKARQLGKRLSANNTKDQIANLLIKHGGNISRVAKEMSISRTTLYKKMRSS